MVLAGSNLSLSIQSKMQTVLHPLLMVKRQTAKY